MKTQKTIVIYHRADFDGIFCREIAKKFLPDAELIGWDYGDPVPTPDVVSADDKLYMLDISVDGLMGHPNLIWIDHHKSAIEKYGAKPPILPDIDMGSEGIPGYQIDGVAACRLAWYWFSAHEGLDAGSVPPMASKSDFINRLVIEPLAVRLAGEYDIWDKRDTNAELFQHGLRSQNLDGLWPLLLSIEGELPAKAVVSLLSAGLAIQYAQTQQNESIIKAYGFDLEFEGLKFLSCNHARFNSHLFKAGIRPDHDALFGFNYEGKSKMWRVSLYGIDGRPETDLSLIAVKYGGGGHKGACGFRLEKLPF